VIFFSFFKSVHLLLTSLFFFFLLSVIFVYFRTKKTGTSVDFFFLSTKISSGTNGQLQITTDFSHKDSIFVVDFLIG